VIGNRGDDGGIATLNLDGKAAGRIDTFAPVHRSEWPTAPPVRLWGVQGLTDGEHTLELTVTGEKHRDSHGASVGLDALVVLRGPTSPPPK
jgi:hypothetical protein